MGTQYKLIGPDGKPYEANIPGTLGGYRPLKIYGKLDCYSANLALAKGGYAKNRVFFADEVTAIAAGYRPCAKCMNAEYRRWKNRH
jgi:methylphosphotriester-DNA--protein-cysteine methyltransferase